MKENRIDKLFKEKVPKSEKDPPQEVWDNISAQLTSRRQNKPMVIPFWSKLAGIAAALIVILVIYKTASTSSITSPAVTDNPVDKDGNFKENFNYRSNNPSSSSVSTSEISSKALPEAQKENSKSKSNRSNYILKVEPLVATFKAENIKQYNFLLPAKTDFLYQTLQKKTSKQVNKISDQNNEEKERKKVPFHEKLTVAPTVAAVYSGKMGAGHALDNEFSGNSNPGEINFVLGFSIAYKISEKLKFRSGINNITFSSTTPNVDNISALNSSAIDPNAAANISIPEGRGTLNQQLGFLEIPLELEHALLDKTVGLNLILGTSTYFLQENAVELKSVVATADLGPANNIKSTSFSANLGLGFTYQFSSKFQINLDPIIKYQINTYENVSDLKPYFFGIYSGIRFKL